MTPAGQADLEAGVWMLATLACSPRDSRPRRSPCLETSARDAVNPQTLSSTQGQA